MMRRGLMVLGFAARFFSSSDSLYFSLLAGENSSHRDCKFSANQPLLFLSFLGGGHSERTILPPKTRECRMDEYCMFLSNEGQKCQSGHISPRQDQVVEFVS